MEPYWQVINDAGARVLVTENDVPASAQLYAVTWGEGGPKYTKAGLDRGKRKRSARRYGRGRGRMVYGDGMGVRYARTGCPWRGNVTAVYLSSLT